jgi:tartrate-resistant acid phosphatase type 5
MTVRRLAAIALLGALGIASGGCGSPTYTVRSFDERALPEPPDLGARAARVLHYGDFGDNTAQQDTVARGIVDANRRDPFDLAFSAGDNIYSCGPDVTLPGADGCLFDASDNRVAPGVVAPDDPRFAAQHEGPLRALAEPPAVRVYLALGNHDVASGGDECRVAGLDAATLGRRRACLEVARSTPLWQMPGRHYVVDHGRARFIVLDTNLVKGGYGGFSFDDEVRFLAEAAEGCADRLCFVIGHHPPVNAGRHTDDATPAFLARMERLHAAGAGRIRAWLAGHDHDLQHLRAPAGFDVFVSGNGARGRRFERFTAPSVAGTSIAFASVRWGVGVLEVLDGGWTYRFEDVGGAPLYCCAAAGDAPCEPVRCRRE